MSQVLLTGGVVVEIRTNDTPCLLWPFVAIWRLLAALLELTGRILGIILGFILLVVGFVLSLTVVGAIVGIPIIVLGLLIIVRALF
jgi:hypothetical protein